MNLTLINLIALQIGWFACVLGAVQGVPLLGPVVVMLLLALHLFLTADAARELRLLFIAGVVGFLIDTLQAALGIFSFGGTGISSWVSPPWMVALWLNLATALHTSLRWLTGRYALAAVLGTITGPLSYYAGVRLGALTFNPNPVISLVVLALVWGLVLPGLVRLAK